MPECFYRASNFLAIQAYGFPLTACGNDILHTVWEITSTQFVTNHTRSSSYCIERKNTDQ